MEETSGTIDGMLLNIAKLHAKSKSLCHTINSASLSLKLTASMK